MLIGWYLDVRFHSWRPYQLWVEWQDSKIPFRQSLNNDSCLGTLYMPMCACQGPVAQLGWILKL